MGELGFRESEKKHKRCVGTGMLSPKQVTKPGQMTGAWCRLSPDGSGHTGALKACGTRKE
jgi:hypothetical protein